MDDVPIAERGALTVQVSHVFVVREDVHVLPHVAVFVAKALGEAGMTRDEPGERAADVVALDRHAPRATGELTERTMDLDRYTCHRTVSVGSASVHFREL
jgi:hypothetical protein